MSDSLLSLTNAQRAVFSTFEAATTEQITARTTDVSLLLGEQGRVDQLGKMSDVWASGLRS